MSTGGARSVALDSALGSTTGSDRPRPRGPIRRGGCWLAVALAASVSLVACAETGTAGGAGRGRAAVASAGGGSGDASVGNNAPDITVDRLSGGTLSLSSMRGKVVLLDVWASWCGPCKQELPMLDQIAARLKRRGVEVVAVSVDQERDNVEKFLRSRAHWSLTVAHDPNGAVADAFQPDKMPTSYVIDRTGVIRHVNSGFEPSDARDIEARLSDLAGR